MKISPFFVLYSLYLLFRFAQFLLEVPTVRMIEYAVCHQRLNGVALFGLDEAACKASNIQEEVARIVGWKLSFDAIPGMCKFLMKFWLLPAETQR